MSGFKTPSLLCSSSSSWHLCPVKDVQCTTTSVLQFYCSVLKLYCRVVKYYCSVLNLFSTSYTGCDRIRRAHKPTPALPPLPCPPPSHPSSSRYPPRGFPSAEVSWRAPSRVLVSGLPADGPGDGGHGKHVEVRPPHTAEDVRGHVPLVVVDETSTSGLLQQLGADVTRRAAAGDTDGCVVTITDIYPGDINPSNKFFLFRIISAATRGVLQRKEFPVVSHQSCASTGHVTHVTWHDLEFSPLKKDARCGRNGNMGNSKKGILRVWECKYCQYY